MHITVIGTIFLTLSGARSVGPSSVCELGCFFCYLEKRGLGYREVFFEALGGSVIRGIIRALCGGLNLHDRRALQDCCYSASHICMPTYARTLLEMSAEVS